MIIDVSIALILIICIFIGDKKGFFRSFMSTFGCVLRESEHSKRTHEKTCA